MKRILIVGGAAILVLSIVMGGWLLTVDFDLPEPTGSYAVGRSQTDVEGDRRLAITLYYPAQHETGSLGPYMPSAIADDVARRDLGIFHHVPDPWARVEHHSYDDATWASGTFPLILFSPGADVQPQYYSSMLAEIASHGYVVAALSHPGFTPFIAYTDGSVATSTDPPMPASPEEALRQHEQRIELVAHDIAEVAARLRSNPNVAEHLDGRLGVFGHSLGGAAAATAAVRDPTFQAVGDMDGSLGEAARHVALERPVFFMTDDGPVAAPDQAARSAFVQGGEPGLKVTLHGGSHMTFATDTNFFEEAIPFADGDDLGAREAHADITKPLVEFFDRAFSK